MILKDVLITKTTFADGASKNFIPDADLIVDFECSLFYCYYYFYYSPLCILVFTFFVPTTTTFDVLSIGIMLA